MRTIILSDIHIGNNNKTCWYQKPVHEPYMLALLDYILQNANQGYNPINRLVVLGDLFDFWTYPPSTTPPTIKDILDANPNLFAADGKFARVVQALNGNVQYIHGNHDILLNQADLDVIPAGQYRVQLLPDIVLDRSGIVFTHGHLATMFNAPDSRYPGQVPVGHFVTRAIAYMLENTLPPGTTAADLPDQGSPYGFSLSSLIPGLSDQFKNPSVTNLLLDYIAARCGLDENTPIQMGNGKPSMTIKLAKTKYDGLFTQWSQQNGGGDAGSTIAAKAAQADYNGQYMAWFAQRFAFQNNAKGIVMGHTHVPKVGIEHSWCQYVNNGFECPSVPDIAAGRTHWNFTEVADDGTMQLMQVYKPTADTYQIQLASAPEDQVVYSYFEDYSCYVKITNNSPSDLVLQSQKTDSGFYVVPPPDRVAANQSADVWMEDLVGVKGSEGKATYRSDDANPSFSFSCPTAGFNSASGSKGAPLLASSKNPPNPDGPYNKVPGMGHPLFVQFFTRALDLMMTSPSPVMSSLDSAALPPWIPTSPLARAVDLAGFEYDPGQGIIYSKMNPLQRSFGYAYGYDASALLMSAVIDCEPIFFDYAGKTWMIELWKGQYGLETGCEIGVYTRPIGSTGPFYAVLDHTVGVRANDTNPEHNQYFDCAADSDLLVMSSVLYRNGQKLFARGPEPHWWLTGFKWGVFSAPEDLTMDVSITCKDELMARQFVSALQALGYQKVSVSGAKVGFLFATPHTYQPRSADPVAVKLVQASNSAVVDSYNALGLRSNDPNSIPATSADMILNSVSIYGSAFFSQAVANLGKAAGVDASQLLGTLVQKFQDAAASASNFLTQAGYSFSSWMSSLEGVLGINLNYSCVIEICNGGPYTLILVDTGTNYGDYVVAPPTTIVPGQIVRYWLKDPKPSFHGAQGWVKYSYVDFNKQSHTSTFSYDCPTGVYLNTVSVTPGTPLNFYTQSGTYSSGGWGPLNRVQTLGHPLYVAFVWGIVPPPT
jgi:UDP-2,3-diacylglucosamine pyrophosphatase LpxH